VVLIILMMSRIDEMMSRMVLVVRCLEVDVAVLYRLLVCLLLGGEMRLLIFISMVELISDVVVIR